jgi:hypothetical protein
VITHDENSRDDCFTTSQNGNIIKISLNRYSDLLGIPKANLRKTIVQNFLRYIREFKAYESDIPARLNSLKEFSDFANGFQAYRAKLMLAEKEKDYDRGFHNKMQLSEALDITENFLRMID